MILSDKTLMKMLDEHTPVSYTHLDVYKRQYLYHTSMNSISQGRYVVESEALFLWWCGLCPLPASDGPVLRFLSGGGWGMFYGPTSKTGCF